MTTSAQQSGAGLGAEAEFDVVVLGAGPDDL
jgi:hypothetical protein